MPASRYAVHDELVDQRSQRGDIQIGIMVSIEAPQAGTMIATEIELRANSPIDESLLDINLVRPELIFDFGIEHDVLLLRQHCCHAQDEALLWNVEVPPPSARSASEAFRNWKSPYPPTVLVRSQEISRTGQVSA